MKLEKVFKVTSSAASNFVKVHGAKLQARLKSDTSVPMLKSEIEGHKGDSLEEKAVNHILSQSPHPKYNNWLVSQYAKGGIPKMDDVSKAAYHLGVYHKHAQKIDPKDIQQVRDLQHLTDITEPHEQTKTRSENEGEMAKQSHLVYNSPEHKIVIPKTEATSVHYGKNTRWCTAAEKSRNYFDTYHDHGNLFYLMHKPTNKKYAIFVPHKAFKDGNYQAPEGFDEKDKAMHPRKIVELFDEAADHLTHLVPSDLHRVTMHLPIPDADYAPKVPFKKEV